MTRKSTTSSLTTIAPAQTVTPTTSITPVAVVVVTPTQVSPGSLVVVSGTNFQAGEDISIGVTRGTTGTVVATETTTRAGTKGEFSGVGVTIPYTESAGIHRVLAVGTTSKRDASAQFNVAALNPHIQLSEGTVKPGALVTIQGAGFAPVEQVVLALNGAALSTTPTSITTTVDGSFSATVMMPTTLLQGLNTITVLGERSRAAASANVIGLVPLATSWYFAGGNNLPPNETYLHLLNPNDQPALVTLSFFLEHGGSTRASITIKPRTDETLPLSTLAHGLVDRRVFTELRSDRHIYVQETVVRPGQGSRTAIAVAAPATTWYLAEGYTGLTFRTEIDLFNPGTAAAHVQLHLLPFNGRAGRTVAVTVNGRAGLAVSLNRYLPNESQATIVTSDQPIVVERTMTFGANGAGATGKAGVLTPSTVWMFADGSTMNDFETFYTILNPSPTLFAQVTASFFDESGTPLGNQTILIAPLHRGNIKLNEVFPGQHVRVSTIVSSNVPVVAERPLYLGPPNALPSTNSDQLTKNAAGADVFGRNGGGVTWIFPAGDTTQGYSESLILFNPGQHQSAVRATFYTDQGKQVSASYAIPPMTRVTILVNAVSDLPAGTHGAVLTTTNGQPFIAEQTERHNGLQDITATQGVAE